MPPYCRLALVAVAACGPNPPPQAPIPPVSAGKVRVRVFTEPSPVRLLASAGRFVFVATDKDIERWDENNAVLPLSGLSGKQIVALASDVDRRWVWILTEAGVGHYDVSAETFHPLPAPPAGLDLAAIAKDGASVAPATDDGAWLGTSRGLYHVGADGWIASTLKDPIHGLVRDRAGWLWIATKGKLVARKPTGDMIPIGAAEGCTIVDPRLIVELPGDRMLVIGADDTGRDRVAFGKQLQWVTYRALPDVKFDAAARRGSGAVVMAGDRVYRISPADPARVRPLARDGMRMVPLVAGHAADWVIDPIDLVVPPGALTLASVDDQLLIGTRELGTARYRDGDPRPRDWLRRRQMFLDATALSVACSRDTDCWIATGTRQAWHWDGNGFAPRGPDELVHAVVRDPGGAIYALHRAPTDTTIRLSRIEPSTRAWIPTRYVIPATEISFARFASTGVLWLGLRGGDATLAIIDLANNKLETKSQLTDIVDGDVRGESAWITSPDVITKQLAGKSEHWTQASARALAIASDGSVYVATASGAARWDGNKWDLPPALGFSILDVAATSNGQIWMATERGIAAWDGQKVRRVDTRRGLAENAIIDVAIDHFDRVWARGPGSLTLISQ